MSKLINSQHLKIKKNFFNLFSALSVELVDNDSGNFLFLAKMSIKGDLVIYADQGKQNPVLKLKSINRLTMNYELYDLQASEQKLGSICSNVMMSIVRAGKENWTIKDENEQEVLNFNAENSGGLLKRMIDNASNLYNPSYQYSLSDKSGREVASISSKIGIFSKEYHLIFDQASDRDMKLILGIFVVMAILLRK